MIALSLLVRTFRSKLNKLTEPKNRVNFDLVAAAIWITHDEERRLQNGSVPNTF